VRQTKPILQAEIASAPWRGQACFASRKGRGASGVDYVKRTQFAAFLAWNGGGVENKANPQGQDWFGASLLAMTGVRVESIMSNEANSARPKPGNPKHKARNSKQARKRNAPNAQQSPFRPAGAPNEPNFRFFRPEPRVARKNKANLRRSEGRDWGFGIADWRLETGDSRGSRDAVPVCQTRPMSKWVALATPRGWRITLSQRRGLGMLRPGMSNKANLAAAAVPGASIGRKSWKSGEKIV